MSECCDAGAATTASSFSANDCNNNTSSDVIIPEVYAIPEPSSINERSTSVVAEVTVVTPISSTAESNNDNDTNDDDPTEVDGVGGSATNNAGEDDTDSLLNQKRRAYKKLPVRPAITSISVFKVTRDEKLGVGFKSINGRLQISKFITENEDGGGPPNLLGSKFGTKQPASAVGESSNNNKSSPIPSPPIVQVGDFILSINNTYCALWDPKRAVDMLKSLVGLITIQIMPNEEFCNEEQYEIDDCLCQAVVYKTNITDKLGIAFDKISNVTNGRLRISSLHPNGLLGGNNSALSVGDYLIEINGINCSEVTPRIAKEMIQNSNSSCIRLLAISTDSTAEISSRNVLMGLSSGRFLQHHHVPSNGEGHTTMTTATPIISEDQDENGNNISVVQLEEPTTTTLGPTTGNIVPAYISVMVVKPTKGTSLGIQLKKCPTSNHIVVKNILEGSIISNTPLRIGMILLSIDTVPCYDMTKEIALTKLRNSIGQIHIVAQNVAQDANPNYVQAMITKIHGPNTKLGVGFRSVSNREGRQIQISSINPDGLFVNSVLNTYDIVLSVNGNRNVAINNMTSTQLVEYIKTECREYVTIVTKTSSSTGVVVFSS